ncbi:uncharacterized protein LOC141520823 isoform X1 [Macrotis lagotis]|uniref:uncharacterized protein LOC141520823 isoform X1 n=1 Tax=Macrotis lagotis TaxID=92651 RepID=UPI003D687225
MPKKDSWNLTDPLGISVLPLSNRVYRKMMAGPRMALHVKKLSILRTKLKTITGGTPTVGLYFQVHSSERPDNFITPHNCMDVPVLNPIFLDTDLGTIRGSWAKDYILSEPGSVPETGQEPDPVAKTPETELMTEFYPFFMYKRLFGPSVEQAKPQEYSQETVIHSWAILSRFTSGPLKDDCLLVSTGPCLKLEDLSIRWPHQKSVYRLQSKAQSTKALPKEKTNENSQLSQGTTQPSSSPDYPDLSVTQGHHSEVEKVNQSDALLQERKEVDNCQKALIKMANDILSLRKQVTSLETENNSLRQQVYAQEMMGQASPEDEEMIENMKQKLSQSTNEMRRLKDRVQQLQNELIRKNDLEKDLLLIQQSHQQQQKHLKTYQDKLQKMESLEQTVKNQEKVIQTMEKILEEKIKQPSRERLNALVSSLEQPPGKTMGFPFRHIRQTQSNSQIGERSKSDSDFGKGAGRIISSLGPRKAKLNLEAFNSRPWLYSWIWSYINRAQNEKSEYRGMKMICPESQNKGMLRSVQLSKSRKNRIRYRFIQSLTCKYYQR